MSDAADDSHRPDDESRSRRFWTRRRPSESSRRSAARGDRRHGGGAEPRSTVEAAAERPRAAGQAADLEAPALADRRGRVGGGGDRDRRLAAVVPAAGPGAGAPGQSDPGDRGRGRLADRPPRLLQGGSGRRRQAAGLCARRVHRHRGPALLQAHRRRSQGDPAGRGRQRQGRRGVRGRLDHHPATGQERLPVQQAHLPTQDPGGADRPLSGRPAVEGRDPVALPVVGLFRRRHLRPGRGRRGTISTRRPST
jgi:hypothetical protein